jgi:hypothetical protein
MCVKKFGEKERTNYFPVTFYTTFKASIMFLEDRVQIHKTFYEKSKKFS